jgi:hypothetical protein
MNAYEHKHTREVRVQEFSPGDDWELIVAPTWVDWTIGVVGLVLFVLFIAWMEGK